MIAKKGTQRDALIGEEIDYKGIPELFDGWVDKRMLPSESASFSRGPSADGDLQSVHHFSCFFGSSKPPHLWRVTVSGDR